MRRKVEGVREEGEEEGSYRLGISFKTSKTDKLNDQENAVQIFYMLSACEIFQVM